jgi:hypothetical protein
VRRAGRLQGDGRRRFAYVAWLGVNRIARVNVTCIGRRRAIFECLRANFASLDRKGQLGGLGTLLEAGALRARLHVPREPKAIGGRQLARGSRREEPGDQ